MSKSDRPTDRIDLDPVNPYPTAVDEQTIRNQHFDILHRRFLELPRGERHPFAAYQAAVDLNIEKRLQQAKTEHPTHEGAELYNCLVMGMDESEFVNPTFVLEYIRRAGLGFEEEREFNPRLKAYDIEQLPPSSPRLGVLATKLQIASSSEYEGVNYVMRNYGVVDFNDERLSEREQQALKILAIRDQHDKESEYDPDVFEQFRGVAVSALTAAVKGERAPFVTPVIEVLYHTRPLPPVGGASQA